MVQVQDFSRRKTVNAPPERISNKKNLEYKQAALKSLQSVH